MVPNEQRPERRPRARRRIDARLSDKPYSGAYPPRRNGVGTSSISSCCHFLQAMPPATDGTRLRSPLIRSRRRIPSWVSSQRLSKGGVWRLPPAESRHLPKYRCLAPSPRSITGPPWLRTPYRVRATTSVRERTRTGRIGFVLQRTASFKTKPHEPATHTPYGAGGCLLPRIPTARPCGPSQWATACRASGAEG